MIMAANDDGIERIALITLALCNQWQTRRCFLSMIGGSSKRHAQQTMRNIDEPEECGGR